jgi:MGT family glycosyltransferase
MTEATRHRAGRDGNARGPHARERYRARVARIALLGIGMWGHLAPLSRLGSVLAGLGHELEAWVPASYCEPFSRIGSRLHPHEPVPVRRGDLDLIALAQWLAEGTERCVGELVEALDERGIDMVVHDVHVPWARVAADFLGLPRVVTTPLFPPALPGEAGVPGFATGLPADASDRLAAVSDVVARRWGVELGDWRRIVWSDGEAVVNFSTEQVTGRGERAPAWTYVGPLLGAPPERPSRGRRPLAYVSFGTFYGISERLIRSTVQALAELPIDVLLSTGRTAVAPAVLDPLPPRFKVHEFVAGREALARADVFVTHGGCSSVHEALVAGVPMVCLPQGADQFDWSRRVAELGAGRVLWSPEVQAVRDAAAEVLAHRRYGERSREVGEGLRRFPGPARVEAVLAAVAG